MIVHAALALDRQGGNRQKKESIEGLRTTTKFAKVEYRGQWSIK